MGQYFWAFASADGFRLLTVLMKRTRVVLREGDAAEDCTSQISIVFLSDVQSQARDQKRGSHRPLCDAGF